MEFEFVKRQPVLENSPLKLVICQMRFSRQVGITESDVRPIQRALSSRYPLVEVGRSASFVLGPAGVAPAGDADPLFQFRSDDATWTVTVTPDSVSLETTEYHDFHDFLSRWVESVAVVLEALDADRQHRIGLRYVNELPCPLRPAREDLLRMLRDDLAGVVGGHARTTALLQSMHEMRFAQDRGVCTLRHGLVPRDGDAGSYLLDFDFYDDEPQPFDLEAQQRVLAEFNHGAFDLFEWLIPDEFFATFRPREGSDA